MSKVAVSLLYLRTTSTPFKCVWNAYGEPAASIMAEPELVGSGVNPIERCPAYSAAKDWTEIDDVARLAHGFALHLAEVTCIRTTAEPNQADSVNAHIAMIAEETDALITALIRDAAAHGLEASSRWMKIPLAECREFEVVEHDAATGAAGDIHDQKLNS